MQTAQPHQVLNLCNIHNETTHHTHKTIQNTQNKLFIYIYTHFLFMQYIQ